VLAPVLVFPFGPGQVGIAIGFLEFGQIEMRPQPGPEHDDDDVAFRRLGLELDHRFLRCETGWQRRRCRRIVPTHDIERDTATQKRINGQIILEQAQRQSAFIGHIAGRGEKDAQVQRHWLPSTIQFFDIMGRKAQACGKAR